MKLIIKLFLNAIAVFVIAHFLSGVHVNDYFTALAVAAVIAVLNLLVKPVLVILTLPITILTLGLFLLVVNAFIILLADHLITGFSVNSIWTAIWFSIFLSILQWLLHTFLGEDKKRRK